MKNISDVMKNLQQASDRLSQLNLNQSNPWQSLSQMQDLFGQEFWSQFNHLSQLNKEIPVSSTSIEDKPGKFVPPIDVYNTLGRVIICCLLPGLNKNSLKISVKNESQLIIRGIIKEHNLAEYRIIKESFEGKFSRQIDLPSAVSSKSVKTAYRDGILELYLIKKNATEPHNSDELDVNVDL